jgi:hypothetical protein
MKEKEEDRPKWESNNPLQLVFHNTCLLLPKVLALEKLY